MRKIRLLLSAGAALWTHPAFAADALKFGGPPAWVHPRAIPAAKPSQAPVSLLLTDEQISLQPGKSTTYSEGALRINNAQGLGAGNVALAWQPATDTVTVNKLQIRRGDKVIDVLASGQTFTVLRRETNLEAATLDGTLTATIQPEGLQDGDIIDFATTIERTDPVLKGHVEAMFAGWNALPVQSAHATLRWPAGLGINVKQTPDLPPARKSTGADGNVIELAAQDVQPVVPPKGAPTRFRVGRLAQATDFASWDDVSALMLPLFKSAAAIPATGPLHDEVEKIRSASPDPKVRAAQALALVQDRIRYVALLMGSGGYVPASAEQTWSRRFGDCKAKTALLMGILQSLGINAEPVLVNASLGDMIGDRLPGLSLFNHVLVRAHLGGHDYWLDGTRAGDADLDKIEVPDFGWGLPLVEHAQLIHLVPAPLTVPDVEHRVVVDASAGALAPSPVQIDEIYRGDSAVQLNLAYSSLTAEQRDEALADKGRTYFDDFKLATSKADFDKSKREFTIHIDGKASLGWKDGWAYVPTSSLGFDPDYDRQPGPLHDAPVAVNHPRYVLDRATIKLPPNFAAAQKLKTPVRETLAGVEYARTEQVSGPVLTVQSSERSIAPEVPYKDAIAAAPRLHKLNDDDIYLSGAVSYQASPQDLAALTASARGSVDEYIDRGNVYLDSRKYDEAIADFTKALETEPKNVTALADRALAYIYNGNLDQAAKDLAAAKAITPNNAVLNRAQGLYFEQKGDLRAAIDAYTASLQADPSSTYARERRATAQFETGNREQAIADIDQALTRNPNAPELHLMRARFLASSGKKDAALSELDIVAKGQPNDAGTMAAMASVYSELGMPDRATQLLDKAATESSGDDAESLTRKAAIEFQTDNYAAALADSQRSLVINRKQPELRVMRANIEYLQGNKGAVRGEAEALTRDNPDSEYAFVGAAKIYARLGLTAEAFTAIDRAIALKPLAYVYLNRADIRPRTDVKGRLADYDAALKLEPTNEIALIAKSKLLADSGDAAGALKVLDQTETTNTVERRQQRAVLLYKVGRVEESRKLFEAIRADTHDPTELNNLCYSKATTGVLLESAVDDCNEALRLKPDTPGFEDSLGLALLRLGKVDEAIAAYDRALKKDKIADSYMGRSIAYAQKGNAAAARKDRAAALHENPDVVALFESFGLKP